MTKHTPGPWHIGMKPGPIIYGPLGEQVAVPTALFLGAEEARVNARLIAAAPELLEALKGLVSIVEDEYPPTDFRHQEAMKAKAIIAKAEGSND